MRAFRVVIAMACLVTGACSAPVTRLDPTLDPWTNYELGREQSSATGSPMVVWFGHAGFLRGYVMVLPLEVEGIGRQPPAPSTGSVWGARYAYDGECAGGEYVVTHPSFYNESIGVIIGAGGLIPCADSVLQVLGAKRGRDFETPDFVGAQVFEPAGEPFIADHREAPIKWELIYSGRSGDEIALTYREYAAGRLGTFARPAFYQELQYDLAASGRIVFRETEIEILEASNAGVRYRVLREGF